MSEQQPTTVRRGSIVRRGSPDPAAPPTAGLPDHPNNHPTTQPRDRALLPWLAASVLALTVAALAAAWAPKMVGLFLVGFGLLAGALLGALARVLQFGRRAVVPLSALLIAVSLVGLTLRTHQIWAERTKTILQNKGAPPALLPSGSLEGLPEDVRRTFESAAAAQRPDLGFAAYLRDRTAPLGSWPAPWSVIFWGAEIVLGTAAGAWVIYRLAGQPGRSDRRRGHSAEP